MLFKATGDLALLPKTMDRLAAIDFFEKEVAGVVGNIHGDPVIIRPGEANHRFEQKKTKSGRLKMERVRRLPWIRPVIEGTSLVKQGRKGRELYLAEIGVYVPHMGGWAVTPFGFCVVVSVARSGKRFFVTAYPIGNRNSYEERLRLPDTR